MELVSCDRQYWEFVRKLRTNPKNQDGFFSYAEITPEQQEVYMGINSPKYMICLMETQPVGYVGLLGGHEIVYCVSPEFHGKGVGTFMVKEYSLYWDNIDAFVKVDNIPSQKVFEKLGWEKQYYYKYKKNNV
jgi:RimJ/RimL family protein N-acetyltransferase|tara:strand:- start:322 stop:717 length:396 start_codon:yes stop_codon:yes gene_type:complete